MARLVRERSDIIPLLGEVFRAHGYEGASLQVIGAAVENESWCGALIPSGFAPPPHFAVSGTEYELL